MKTRLDMHCDTRDAADKLLQQSSPVYKSLVGTTNQFLVSSRPNGMPPKEKVLALLAVHAMTGTEQSVEFAVTAAVHLGIHDDQIMDALDLALLTGGGAAVARVQLAINVLKFRQTVAGTKFQFIDMIAQAGKAARTP